MNTLNCMMAGVGLLSCMAGMTWAGPAPAGPPKAESPTVTSVSGPFTQGNLTVFLLHGADVLPGKTILTLQEALAAKKSVVHETSSVNELAVENLADDALLFIQSGDIVKGGKQDRAIAFDMLLPPKSGKVPIGSFCVEAGRWRQRGGEAAAMFGASTTQIAGRELKNAVIGNDATKQGEVWKEVSNTQGKLSKNAAVPVADRMSPSSLQLSLENKQLQDKLAAYDKALTGAIDGKSDVIGMALCVNGKVTGAEMYGSAALFRKLWPKLLKSAATEAMADLDEKKKFEPATAKAVEAFMAEAAAGAANEVQMADAPRQQQDLQQQAGVNEARDNRPNTARQAEVAQATPARVRIVRYDGKKALLIESQDKEGAMPAVVHRCYIAK